MGHGLNSPSRCLPFSNLPLQCGVLLGTQQCLTASCLSSEGLSTGSVQSLRRQPKLARTPNSSTSSAFVARRAKMCWTLFMTIVIGCNAIRSSKIESGSIISKWEWPLLRSIDEQVKFSDQWASFWGTSWRPEQSSSGTLSWIDDFCSHLVSWFRSFAIYGPKQWWSTTSKQPWPLWLVGSARYCS